jgi:hypothetical protein
MTTSGGGIISRNNSYTNLTLSNCIVDLDTNYFESVTFVNSVVRYHGGAISLRGVGFINCSFVLDLKTQPTTSAQRTLLLAILKSPDQKTVQIPN